MSKIIDEDVKVKLKQILSGLVSPVKLLFFTQKNACPSCAQQRELLEALSALSDKIELKVYDFVLNGEEAISYQIDKIPATAVIGEKNYGIRFYGLTFGYEFDSLLESIIMV
jgi:alkyl hydroperoxide reductase subunit AhpF